MSDISPPTASNSPGTPPLGTGRLARKWADRGRALAIPILGLLVPIVLLFQAYLSMSRLDQAITKDNEIGNIAKSLPEVIRRFDSPNDYAILAVGYLEASNALAVVNRQRAKVAAMHIGFAVISLGLLLILTGVETGGIDVAGEAPVSKTPLRLQISSTGVAIFVLGSVMSGAAALMPSHYQTVSVPSFLSVHRSASGDGASNPSSTESVSQLQSCVRDTRTEDDRNNCFMNVLKATVPQAK